MSKSFLNFDNEPREDYFLKLAQKSCEFLEQQFFKQVQKKGKLYNMPNMSTNLQYVYGYVMEYVMKQEHKELYSLRNSSEDIVWTLCYFALKCGLQQDLIEYLEHED